MTPVKSETEGKFYFSIHFLYHFNYVQVIRPSGTININSQGTSKAINKVLRTLFLRAYQNDKDI